MTPEEFRNLTARLSDWVRESDMIFFINGYLGHSISANAGKLIIIESDGGERGAQTIIEPDDVESMEFLEDEYKFSIVLNDDHDNQGYDIEAYCLTRVDFPKEV